MTHWVCTDCYGLNSCDEDRVLQHHIRGTGAPEGWPWYSGFSCAPASETLWIHITKQSTRGGHRAAHHWSGAESRMQQALQWHWQGSWLVARGWLNSAPPMLL